MNSSSRKKNSGVRTHKKKRPRTLNRISTGIRGLDTSLQGGLPEGRTTIIIGQPGCCKTLLGCEFLYRGITVYDEPGVLLTLEEPTENIIRNIESFGWNFDQLVDDGKLAIVDAGFREFVQVLEVDKSYDLSPIVVRLKQAIKRTGAKRVVIDGLSSMFEQISEAGIVRNLFFMLCQTLEEMKVTALITIEERGHNHTAAHSDIMRFVADGVIELQSVPGQQQLVRTMLVRKLRGVGYRSGEIDFDIDEQGIIFYPKIPVTRKYVKIAKGKRLSTGISSLDSLIGGGIPRGHMILVSGNTGCGKTILCSQFLHEGLENGESAIFVSLEEPASQVIRNVRNQSIRFAPYWKSGKLRFIDAPLIDLYPDKLLYDIVNAIDELGATRLVFDSLSTIESGTLEHPKVREFLFQLVEYTKSKGVTCLFSFLVTDLFGAAKGQMLAPIQSTDLRLSSVVDGIFLLRYFENEKTVGRFLNVLKLRGSRHRKELYVYTIGKHGIQIEAPLKAGSE